MLLEFRVANFRSILDEQVLSLVASKDKTNIESHCSPTGLAGLPYVVRSAALFGANASGKSNLLMALGFFQSAVKYSAQNMTEGQSFPLEPFRFAPGSSNEPTEMEITFVEDGVRYQYGFSLDKERVREEWLLVYKTRKPQTWFHRTLDPATQKTEYAKAALSGERRLWEKSTRANALFLSTAVQLNSEQLRPVFQWITERLTIPRFSSRAEATLGLIETVEGKEAVLEFLKKADLGIEDASVRRVPIPEETLRKLEQIVPAEIRENWQGETIEVELEHRARLANGEFFAAKLPLDEESLGTVRMFGFAGPILKALRNGSVLVVDELDRSLHPLLVRFLVSMFHERNGKGAQLIITTHSSALLSGSLLRRDQIFLVEKDPGLGTRIVPLTDFQARKDAPLEKSYLQGRVGAVPIL